MRTKDEILDSSKSDIMSESFRDKAPLWLEYRKLEVLIDIRDTLKNITKSLIVFVEETIIKR